MLFICNNHGSVVDSGCGAFGGDEPLAVVQYPFEDLGLLLFHIGARCVVLQEADPPGVRVQSLQPKLGDPQFDIWSAEDDTAPVPRPCLPILLFHRFELRAVVGEIGIDIPGGPGPAPAINAQFERLFSLGRTQP